MAKTLVVGDVHLKASSILPAVDEILVDEGPFDRVVFLGDICDEWGAEDGQMMREVEEFADWAEEQRAGGLEVDVLFGNHDFQYLLGKCGPGTHMDLMGFVRTTLFELEPQIACEVDGFLLTHAGLTQWFVDEHLDEPATAEEAAGQINGLLAERIFPALETLFSCGMLMVEDGAVTVVHP